MKNLISMIRIAFLALFLFIFFTGNTKIWFMFFGVTLLLAVVFGRIFCGFACPMNTLMIPTEKISKKFGLQKEKAPEWMKSEKLPWFVIIFSIIIMVFSKKVLKVEIPLIFVFLILSVITTSYYKAEIFHNHICPFSVMQKLFGRYTYFSHLVNEDLCVGCGRCIKECPTEAIALDENKKAVINRAYCHQCTNCQQSCPVKAINYTK